MMFWKLCAAVVVAGCLLSPRAQAQTTQPTNAQLQQIVLDLQREVAALKAASAGATAEQRRAEILAVLKELGVQTQAASPADFRVFWKDGIHLETADKAFRLKIGGRIHNDWAWIDSGDQEDDQGVENADGVELRRLYLTLGGQIYESLEFQWEMDFANNTNALKDTYLRFLKVPVAGAVTVGHFKEPFSLDEVTSDNYLTFIERALPNALVPSRNMGVMANNALLGERATWAAGLFRQTDDSGNLSADGGYNFTGRATGLPWYCDQGRQLVHLGAAYSFRDPGSAGYSSRPENHLAPRLVDTGTFPVEEVHLFGAEAAGIWGPFHAESEFVAARAASEAAGNPCLTGWYAQAGYFLTGEVRPYKTATGMFDRVRPLKNFRGKEGGLGAWELALRYSNLDLQDIPVTGGILQDITVGLNWYLNPNVRISWNYIHSCLERNAFKNSDTDALLMRFNVFF